MTLLRLLRIYLGVGAGFGLFIFFGTVILKKLFSKDWYMERRAKDTDDTDFPKFLIALDDSLLITTTIKIILIWPWVVLRMIFKQRA